MAKEDAWSLLYTFALEFLRSLDSNRRGVEERAQEALVTLFEKVQSGDLNEGDEDRLRERLEELARNRLYTAGREQQFDDARHLNSDGLTPEDDFIQKVVELTKTRSKGLIKMFQRFLDIEIGPKKDKAREKLCRALQEAAGIPRNDWSILVSNDAEKEWLKRENRPGTLEAIEDYENWLNGMKEKLESALELPLGALIRFQRVKGGL